VQGEGVVSEQGGQAGRSEVSVTCAVEEAGQVGSGVVVGVQEPVLDQIEQSGQVGGLIGVENHTSVG
jgi:hypothetical protein